MREPAHLFLARLIERRQEMAIRAALGAAVEWMAFEEPVWLSAWLPARRAAAADPAE